MKVIARRSSSPIGTVMPLAMVVLDPIYLVVRLYRWRGALTAESLA